MTKKLTRFYRCHLICLWVLLLAPTMIAEVSAESAETFETFTFLTWSEYIDPDLVREFEQQFNAKINFVYFETDDVRDSMMAATQSHGVDLILLSKLMLNQYIRQGWLQEINYQDIPNSHHLHGQWLPKNPDKQYQVPYFWGTLGIAYRQDLLKDKITSWRQFFSPDASLRGKILMLDNAREITGLALKTLGYSSNSSDLNQIGQANELLQAQKPFVKEYGYLTIMERSPLVTGEIVMSMIYSGDALFLKKHHPDITFVLPEEGSIIWTDVLVISRNSRKQALILKFINFLNEPKNAARNATFVHYATPNKSAEKYLSTEFLGNPIIYPSKLDKARLDNLETLPINAQRLINSIMLDLTRPQPSQSKPVIRDD